jgi:hypothetical protein
MKKKIFTLLALFTCVLSASADNTISVKKVYITPGGVASFGIDLDNTDELCGFTMFMTLPEGITLNGTQKCGEMGEDGCAINKTTRTQGELVDPTGSNPYGLGYISTKALPGNSGSIIQVNIKAASTLAAGTILNGKIDKINFGSLSIGEVSIPDANFQIEVTDKVVLDENATVGPTAQTSVNVLVKRTINKNVWGTICLPFDMTSAQIKSVFGDDAKFCEFENYSKTTDENYTLNFTETDWEGDGSIYANTPYLIKISKDISEFTLDGVTLDPDDVDQQYKKSGKEGHFKGVYYACSLDPNCLFVSNSKIYYSTGKTNIKGYRCYFTLKDFNAVSASAPEFEIVIGGNTTDINEVRGLFEDGAFYDMKGMKIENPTKKGVYIQNGKKVVIK